MKVTLISTVKDTADRVEPFLASLAAQTRAPDEVVIVDGGSSDDTADRFRADPHITVIEAPGTNIAAGRNVALSHATHEVIAATDADCELDPGWLAAIVAPIEAGADVAAGFYLPIARGFWQTCLAAINLPADATAVDPERFMPSARSVAFRRDAIDAVGGYPEWLDIGEDMWVDHRWRERGMHIAFAPEAVVRWPLRPNLRATWLQYFGYGKGDAIAGMHPERHALRVGAYAGLAAAIASRRRWPKAAAATAGALYAAGPVVRARSRFDDPGRRTAAVLAVPALMAWIDTAKLAGYASGLAVRLRAGSR